jgi:S1-C subfamily serine protease
LAQAQLTSSQIAEKADASLALVLAARTAGSTASAVGAAVAVRPNGVLLTSYRFIKDARALQVRLKSGEVFDRVQLLGVDQRRDVAAIKITGTLEVVPVANVPQSAAGDAVVLVSLGARPQWSVSEGAVAAYLMADEVPGAGKGYRVIRFMAPAGLGSGAGILLDSRADLLGLVVGPYAAGADGNLAVPIESVLGLADSAPSKSFASGDQLSPPASPAPVKPPLAAAIPPPPKSSQTASVQPPAAAVTPSPAATSSPAATGSPSLTVSPSLTAPKDRGAILRSLKTLYVDAEGAKNFGNEEMKQALAANKAFPLLNLQIVDDRNAADAVLEIKHSLGGEYPFEVRSRNNVLLLTGSANGYTAAKGTRDVALYFVQMLRPFREAPKPPKK